MHIKLVFYIKIVNYYSNETYKKNYLKKNHIILFFGELIHGNGENLKIK